MQEHHGRWVGEAPREGEALADASSSTGADGAIDLEAVFAITRPDPKLLIYYIAFSCAFVVLMPLVVVPYWLRYRTLRYRFDEEGISVGWGALKRREVNLAYARIQDIHLTSNALERWLGLARIQIQTASGSQKAEVTIEGIRDFAMLRSFLVERMRHARGDGALSAPSQIATTATIDDATLQAVTESLEAVTESLRAVRAALEARTGGP